MKPLSRLFSKRWWPKKAAPIRSKTRIDSRFLRVEALEDRNLLTSLFPYIVKDAPTTTQPQNGTTTTNASPVISVQYSEAMVISEATNPANYNLFDTEGTPITINAVSWDLVTNTATLTYNSGDILPIDTYSLFVRGDQIHSALPSGLPLSLPGQLVFANGAINNVTTVGSDYTTGLLGSLSNFPAPTTPGTQPKLVYFDNLSGVSADTHTVTLGTQTSGNFTLTFNTLTTIPIPFNASAAAVQQALVSLESVGIGNMTVTGPAGGPFRIVVNPALVGTITGDFSQLSNPGTANIPFQTTPIPDMIVVNDHVDPATSKATASIEIYQGRWGGGFDTTPVIQLPVSGAGAIDPDIRAITTADFDGKNGPDIAITKYNLDQVEVFLNTTQPGGAIDFGSGRNWSMGDGPVGVSGADMDGDGFADLSATNGNTIFRPRAGGSSVGVDEWNYVVRKGIGDGTFANLGGNRISGVVNGAQVIQVGDSTGGNGVQSPGTFVAAPIGGPSDTKPDIIVASSNGIGVLINSSGVGGNILFEYTTWPPFPSEYGEFGVPRDPSLQRIYPEFGFFNSGDHEVIDRSNKPGGTGASYVDVQVGYFNADKFLDIAGLTTTGKINIFFNNGAAAPPSGLGGHSPLFFNYAPSKTIGLGSFTPPIDGRLVAKDFDGDGLDDLVATVDTPNASNLQVPGNVYLVRNLGVAGGFGFSTPVPYKTAGQPLGVAVADTNQDGLFDVAVAGQEVMPPPPSTLSLDAVSILRGDGKGGLVVSTDFPITPANTNPVATASADMNGDGRPDLVAILQNTNKAAVFLADVQVTLYASQTGDTLAGSAGINNLQQTSALVVGMSVVGAGIPAGTTIATINSATQITLSNVVATTAQRVPLRFVDSTGTFTLTFGGQTTAPIAADATAADVQAALALLSSIGPGNVSVTSVSPTGGPYSIILKTYVPGSPDFSNLSKSISASYSLGYAAPTYFDVGANPVGLALGDLDLDGNIDIAVANNSGNSVTTLFNDGTGKVFARLGDKGPGTDYAVGKAPTGIVLADFDGDGGLDIAVSHNSPGGKSNDRGVSLRFNLGDRLFATGVEIPQVSGTSVSALAVTDFNRDGKQDILVAENRAKGNIIVLIGMGTGTFVKAGSFGTVDQPGSLAVDDFNRDGYPDVVVTSQSDTPSSGQVGVMLNAFGTALNTLVSTTVLDGVVFKNIAVTNVNQDAFPDLVLSVKSETTIDPNNPGARIPRYSDNNVYTLLGSGDGTFQTLNVYQQGGPSGVDTPNFAPGLPTYGSVVTDPYIKVMTFSTGGNIVTNNLLRNPSFEKKDLAGEKFNVDGWTAWNLTDTHGRWTAQNGTSSPISLAKVQAPPRGLNAVMADEADLFTPGTPTPAAPPSSITTTTSDPHDYDGTRLLYQDVFIPANVSKLKVSFFLYVYNFAGSWSDTTLQSTSLNYNNGQNQQVRIDLVVPPSTPAQIMDIADYNTSTNPPSGSVLKTLFLTNSSTPLQISYTPKILDLTGDLDLLAGKTVRFRIAAVNNLGKLIVGLDNVQMRATYVDEAPPLLAGLKMRNPGTGATPALGGNTTDPTIVGQITDDGLALAIGSPNNIATLSFDVNGNKVFTDPGDITTATWDAVGNFSVSLPNLQRGTNTIGVQARDKAGNLFTTAITFNYLGKSSTLWAAEGPAQISTAGTGVGYPDMSGRVTAIVTDPRDISGNTYLIGSANGGVWKTVNGGQSWTPLTDNAGVPVAVGGMALDILNPDTIYVGTGVGDNQPDSHPGIGVLKSIDGGRTWVVVGNSASVLAGARVTKVLVGSNVPPGGGPNAVYVAVAAGGAKGPGVYRSLDGGVTWDNFLTPARMNLLNGTALASVTDMVMNPFDSTQLTIGLGNIGLVGASDTAGVWSSADGGNNWGRVLGGNDPAVPNNTLPFGLNVGRVTLAEGAGRRGDEKYFYVMIANPPLPDPIPGQWHTGNFQSSSSPAVDETLDLPSGLYKAKDGGLNWTRVRLRQNLGGHSGANPENYQDIFLLGADGGDTGAMTVDLSNPNVVYVGGSKRFVNNDPSVLSGVVDPLLIHGFIRVDTTFMRDTTYDTDPNPIIRTVPNDGDDIYSALAAFNAGGNFQNPTGNPPVATPNTWTSTSDATYHPVGVAWVDLETDAILRDGPKAAKYPTSQLPTGIHALTFDAQGRLLTGTEQGIWRGVNHGFSRSGTGLPMAGDMTFLPLNFNLQISSLTSAAVDPSDLHTFYSSQASTGTAKTTGDLFDWVTMARTGPLRPPNLEVPTGSAVRVGLPDPNLQPGSPTPVYRSWAYQNPFALIPEFSFMAGDVGSYQPSAGVGASSQGAWIVPPMAINPTKQFNAGQYYDQLIMGTDRVFVSNTSSPLWEDLVKHPLGATLVTLGLQTGGTFTLSLGGQTTNPLPFDASAAMVQSELAALSSILTGNVTVTGGAGGPYSIRLVTGINGNIIANFTTLSTPGNASVSVKSLVTALAFAPSIQGGIYAGTDRGEVFVTLNNGQDNWPLRNAGLPSGKINGIMVNPKNPLNAFVMFDGKGIGHVFSTTDGGKTWKNISSNLPDYPAYSMAYDTRSLTGAPNGRLYLGTEIGVYTSYNGGASWARLGSGLPNAPVVDLQFYAKTETLAAATQGRGIFTIATDRFGPTVASVSPGTPVNPPLNDSNPTHSPTSITVNFNEPLDPRSLVLSTEEANRSAVVGNSLIHNTTYYSNLIKQYYQTFLQRAPKSTELNAGIASLRAGVTDEKFISTMLGSVEYFTSPRVASNNTNWVNAIYNDLLLRTPTQTELNATLNSLGLNVSRTNTAFNLVLTSDEYRTNIITGYFNKYLRRPPSENEIAEWLGSFTMHGTDEKVLVGVLGSLEYYRKNGAATYIDADFGPPAAGPAIFDPATQNPDDRTPGSTPTAVALADVNGDGFAELITANAGTYAPNRYALTSSLIAGSYTLSFKDYATQTTQTTTPIAFNASAATVQVALEALPAIGPGKVTVTPLTPNQTGNTTSGSAVITALQDTSALAAGMPVTGAGIPAGAVINSIDSPTQITLSQAATATATVPLSFPVNGAFSITLDFPLSLTGALSLDFDPNSYSLILGTPTQTGDTTLGSAIITGLQDTSTLSVGMPVAGTGIPAGSFIASINSPTQITLTKMATGSGTGVVLTFSPNGGTFTLSFKGQTTPLLAFNANATTIQTALENLSTIGAGKAVVTGAVGGPFTVTLDLALSRTGTLSGEFSKLSPVQSKARTTLNMAAIGRSLDPTVTIYAGSVVYSLTLGAPTKGTFTLSFAGQTTPAIAFNATDVDIQTALSNLSTVGVGKVTVSGGVITMSASLGGVLTGNFTRLFPTQPTAGVTGGRQTTPTILLLPVGANPRALTVNDFDGDGRPDLAVANQGTNNVSVFLNQAATPGTFAPAVNYAAGAGPASLAVANFDGDVSGRLDIAVGDSAANIYSLTLGTPSAGAFTMSFKNQVTAAIPFDATAADVQTALEALNTIGIGNATVTGPMGGPFQITLNPILKGTLAGVFTSLVYTQTQTGNTTNGSAVITTLQNVSALAVGMSVTGAGIPAGAVISSLDSPTQITISLPATATAAGVTLTFPAPSTASLSALYNVSILPGLAGGTFGPLVAVDAGIGKISGLAQGDLDGAPGTFPDLVVSGNAGLRVLRNSGGFSFAQQPKLWTQATNSVAVGNIDSDPRLDIVSSANFPGGVVLAFQNGGFQNGNTTTGSTVVTGLTQTATLSAGMAVLGAGIPDGTVISSIDSATQITLSKVVTAGAVGASLGFFAVPTANTITQAISNQFTVGPKPTAVTIADLDGDARNDILVVNNQAQGTMTVLLNKTVPNPVVGKSDVMTFGKPYSYGTGGNPVGLALADTNQDLVLDVATANSTTDDVWTILGNNDGSFKTSTDASFIANAFLDVISTAPTAAQTRSMGSTLASRAQVLITGPRGAATPLDIVNLDPANNNSFQFVFGPQTVDGTYTLTLGNKIKDAVGNSMRRVVTKFAVNSSDDGKFVTGVVHDLLQDRQADTALFLQLLGMVDTARNKLLASYARKYVVSTEYRTDRVTNYLNFYLGSAVQADIDLYVGQLKKGVKDEQVIANIVGSDAYFAGHGGGANGTWVIAAYTDLLGRTPTAAESTAALKRLSLGVKRTSIALGITRGKEFRTIVIKSAGPILDPGQPGGYAFFLGRIPSATEMPALLSQLAAGYENFLTNLLKSSEYLQRAGNTNLAWLTRMLGPTQLNLTSFDLFDSTLTLGTQTAGTFTLTFNGKTTGKIAFDATDLVIQAALEGLTTIGAGNVTVVGAVGGPFTITLNTTLTGLLKGNFTRLSKPRNASIANAEYFSLLSSFSASRQNAANTVLRGTEYLTYQINGWFNTYLHRLPTKAELNSRISQLRSGALYRTVIAGIVSSKEYFEKRASESNQQWLDNVFVDLLGRARGASEGIVEFLNKLNAHLLTRLQVANALLTTYKLNAAPSPEYRTNLITSLFNQYLKRPPSTLEMNAWLAKNGPNERALIASLMSTNEYFNLPHKFP